MGIDELSKVVFELLVSDVIGRTIEILGDSPNGSRVGIDGGRAFSLKFEVIGKPLIF